MFNLNGYKILSIGLKAEYLRVNGQHLINYVSDETLINLYSLHDFYVEVRFDKSKQKIVGIDAFNSKPRLDRYIDQIKLDDLWRL